MQRNWITARRVGAVTDRWLNLDTPVSPNPAEVDLTLRMDTAQCRGRVVDERGSGVPGARVRAMRHRVEEFGAVFSADGQWHVGSSFCSQTETRADGTFELALHPEQRLFLIVEALGYAPQAVTIGGYSGRELTRDLRLDRGRSLFGVARDRRGRRLVGASVELSYDARFSRYLARTDATGGFELHGLPDGEASLEVYGDGADAHLRWQRAVVVDEALPREIAAELGAGPIVFGTAHDELGQPLSGATVCLRGYAANRGSRAPFEELPSSLTGRPTQDQRTRTDAEGRFFFLVRAAQVRDVVLLSDDGTSVLARVPKPRLGVEISLEAVEPSAVIHGMLGAPRGDAAVLLRSASLVSDREVALGADGRFRFGPLPGGEYELFHWDRRSPPVMLKRIELEAGADYGPVEVSPPIPGRVLVPDLGVDVPPSIEILWPNARLEALQALGQGIERTPSGYLSSPLMPGRYLILVSAKGYAPVRRSFSIRDSSTVILELPKLSRRNLGPARRSSTYLGERSTRRSRHPKRIRRRARVSAESDGRKRPAIARGAVRNRRWRRSPRIGPGASPRGGRHDEGALRAARSLRPTRAPTGPVQDCGRASRSCAAARRPRPTPGHPCR